MANPIGARSRKTQPRMAWVCAVLMLALSGPVNAADRALATTGRRPVAIVAAPDGSRLFVANGRAGSVSIVDPAAGKVVAEVRVGREIVDLAAAGEGRLLAVDRGAAEIQLLDTKGDGVTVIERLKVADDPVSLNASTDGHSCVVASLWSRTLTRIACETGRPLESLGSLALPFAPRTMVRSADGEALIVADAFGGKLGVVSTDGFALQSVRNIPAHNIRGLALADHGRTLVVAHQILKRSMKTDFEDVHWGRLITSHLRTLRMDAVLAKGSDEDLVRGGCMIELGSTGEGAADPCAVAVGPTGRVAVALGGVNEIALGDSPSGYFRRYPAGTNPRALAFSADGKTVFSADTLGDTLTAIDARTGTLRATVSLGTRPEPTLVERGERLFHDASLSHDRWMSCQSCHTDGHSNGQLGDTLGDGSYGAPKRVPSLLGVGTSGPWSWVGGMDRLEDQVRKSILLTMRGSEPAKDDVAALTAYLRTLEPPRPVTASLDPAAINRGREVFVSQGCADCHTPPRYTSKGRYDVGLADEAGNTKFNPPSLLGVGVREPLLHDGRARRLEDVFLEHGHPGGAEMSRDEVADLAAFLRSL